MTWAVTGIVKDWIENGQANYGFIVRDPNDGVSSTDAAGAGDSFSLMLFFPCRALALYPSLMFSLRHSLVLSLVALCPFAQQPHFLEASLLF